MLNILFTPTSWAQYKDYENDKQTRKKINALLEDIARHPASGLGKPEALRGDYAGYYSRRIDDKNRLIYRFDDKRIEIVQVGQHYKDK